MGPEFLRDGRHCRLDEALLFGREAVRYERRRFAVELDARPHLTPEHPSIVSARHAEGPVA